MPIMNKLIVYLILCLGFVSIVHATSDGPDYWKVVKVEAHDVLNVRERPDWKSKKVIEIPYNGVCLANLGCIGGLSFSEFTDLPEAEKKKILKKRPRWCKIKFNNTTGWVSAKFLREGQDPECYKK